MAKTTPRPLLTVKETAARLRYSAATVLRRIHEGKLKAIEDGRLIRITPEDLEAFIRSSRRWR
jgi:excisionase family DNA binding protein